MDGGKVRMSEDTRIQELEAGARWAPPYNYYGVVRFQPCKLTTSPCKRSPWDLRSKIARQREDLPFALYSAVIPPDADHPTRPRASSLENSDDLNEPRCGTFASII